MQHGLGRDAAIKQLVEHTLESIHQDPHGDILRAMVRRGFTGFEELTDSRLEAELQSRGLSSAILSNVMKAA